jgi:hypothetical protein
MHLTTDMGPFSYTTLPNMTAGNSPLLAAIEKLQTEDTSEFFCTPPQSQPPPFLRLPIKLHLEITSYFEVADDPAILHLAHVSRYFLQTIAEPDHQPLLRIEEHPLARWANPQLFLAC